MKLFLDVDGCVAPLPYYDDLPWVDYAFYPAVEDVQLYERAGIDYTWFTVKLSRQMGTRIKNLGVDIHWCTMWFDDANKIIGPRLGFNYLPFVDVDANAWRTLSWPQEWKFKFIEEFYKSTDEPFIWIDDEAIPHDHLLDPARVLVIEPEPYLGITPEHIELMYSFIEEVNKNA